MPNSTDSANTLSRSISRTSTGLWATYAGLLFSFLKIWLNVYFKEDKLLTDFDALAIFSSFIIFRIMSAINQEEVDDDLQEIDEPREQESQLKKIKKKPEKYNKENVPFFSSAFSGMGEISVLHDSVILSVAKKPTNHSNYEINFEYFYFIVRKAFLENNLEFSIEKYPEIRTLIFFNFHEGSEKIAKKINEKIKNNLQQLHESKTQFISKGSSYEYDLSHIYDIKSAIKRSIEHLNAKLNTILIDLSTSHISSTIYKEHVGEISKKINYIEKDIMMSFENLALEESTMDHQIGFDSLTKQLYEKQEHLKSIDDEINSLVESINVALIKLRSIEQKSLFPKRGWSFWRMWRSEEKKQESKVNPFPKNESGSPKPVVSATSPAKSKKILVLYNVKNWSDKHSVNKLREKIIHLCEKVKSYSDPFKKGSEHSSIYAKAYVNNLRKFFIKISDLTEVYNKAFILSGQVFDDVSIKIMRNHSKHSGWMLKEITLNDCKYYFDRRLSNLAKKFSNSLSIFSDEIEHPVVSLSKETLALDADLKKARDLISEYNFFTDKELMGDLLNDLQNFMVALNQASDNEEITFFMNAIEFCFHDFHQIFKACELMDLSAKFPQLIEIFREKESKDTLAFINALSENDTLRLCKKISNNLGHENYNNYEFVVGDKAALLALGKKVIEYSPKLIESLENICSGTSCLGNSN